MARSLRAQMLGAVRASLLEALSDSEWAFAERNVVVEESIGGEVENQISIEVLRFARETSVGPQTAVNADDFDDPAVSITDHDAELSIQCQGALAWAWLDEYLDWLQGEYSYPFLEALGFSIVSDSQGIVSLRQLVGARSPPRGFCTITVDWRAIRDRVMVFADTVEVAVSEGEDPGTVNLSLDVSES